METILNYLFWPVIVGIIILIVEYFVIQPLRKANEVSIPPSVGRDWATAIKTAVKKFKAQQSGYIWLWFLPNRNTITLDEWNIQKGQATIMLSVYRKIETWETPVPGLAHRVTVPQLIARYELLIDRTGDIRRLNSVVITTNSQSNYSQQLKNSLPPTTLEIKNRSVKTEKIPKDGIKILVEFDVVNSGKLGKVCPYMEYKVINTIRGDNRSVHSAPKSYAIEALGTIHFRFEKVFYPPDLPLADSIEKVKIEIYPCPD
jgi:hypothetical protein